MKKIHTVLLLTSVLLSATACKSDNLTGNAGNLSNGSIIASGVSNQKTVKRVGAIRGDGIYSDQTELYMSNPEPSPNERIKVNLRAYKGNLTGAFIVFSNGEEIPLRVASKDKLEVFDIWSAEISAGSVNRRYKFKVQNGNDTGWYNAVGFYAQMPDGQFDFWIAPNFHTPDWSKESIHYQIFVDRFHNGNPKNDVKDGEYLFPYPEDPGNKHNVPVKAMAWDTLPERPAKNRDFFGGDIEGVRKKLSYLTGLGINSIYFNPIFHSPSNHKYDTQDYRTIDPHFATNEEFKSFVGQAHSNKVKVIIDGVFNHTGNWHRWFDRAGIYNTTGAYEDKNSPWNDFYTFQSWPKSYTSWWGFDTLPKLDYASRKLRGEIYANPDSIAKHWIEKYGIDGWRLDVPNEAGPGGHGGDHSIWREFRTAVKSSGKDSVILGEIWKNPQPWLQGDQFDGVMNYEGFADPVSSYMTNFDVETHKKSPISTSNFESWIRHTLAKNPMQANQSMMNLLDSHDTSRFMFRAEGDEWKLYEAVIFQMTFVGAPMIYYGDETGMTGDKDPDCRRTFNWNFNSNSHLHKLYKKMIKLRKENSALRTGSFETLHLDDQNQTFAYGRMDKKNSVLVILNNSSATKTVTVPVQKLGFAPGTTLKEELNNTSLSPRTVKVDEKGNITLPVYGHYGAVFSLNQQTRY